MTIAQVAEQMSLPRTFTPQVLGMLARAGIAESKPGRGGGYRLARSPRKISMLEVVEAAEGSLVNERCTMRGGPCRWEDRCAVHDTWVQAAEALRRSLARTSLAPWRARTWRSGSSAKRRAVAPPSALRSAEPVIRRPSCWIRVTCGVPPKPLMVSVTSNVRVHLDRDVGAVRLPGRAPRTATRRSSVSTPESNRASRAPHRARPASTLSGGGAGEELLAGAVRHVRGSHRGRGRPGSSSRRCLRPAPPDCRR